MRLPFYLLFLVLLPIQAMCEPEPNAILGKWISVKKNVIIEVYKVANQYQAKVIWFKDNDDPSRPMRTRKDINNPNKELRDQLILGMDVLDGLIYNDDKHRWEKGKIYDASSGKYWSSVVCFNDVKQMEVKGYWKFELLGRTLPFVRYKP